MKIYNGKTGVIELPLVGDIRILAPSKSLSQDFMPNDKFLELVAKSYESHEIALVVSGHFEMNMLASFPALSSMVCQSVDEAISRFAPKEAPKEPAVEPAVEELVKEPAVEPAVEEFVKEPVVEEAAVVEGEIKEEPKLVEPVEKPVVKGRARKSKRSVKK